MAVVNRSTLPPEVEDRLAELVSGRDPDEASLIRDACVVAHDAHATQQRASGEPYVFHALSVAAILRDLGLDAEAIAAALLHDVVEDTAVRLDEVERRFGANVAQIVDGVTKMAVIEGYGGARTRWDRYQPESLRKLLLAMARDVRVVLVKLADRLHNMRTLDSLVPEKRERIARETLEIYAPLANRLGIGQAKWELEDLAFRTLDPEAYREIANWLNESRTEREQYLTGVTERIDEALRSAGIQADVSGRAKHIYSIWRKMQSKDIDFERVFDVRAVRILVEDVENCYATLGIIHTLWRPIRGEFDDYIASPKRNHYQSLHTAVRGPEGKTLEVQIRTHRMHKQAELGVAAHWRYKENSPGDPDFDRRVAWLRQVLEWKEEESDADDFIDRFKAEVFQDRVYVLTPQGEIVDMQQGATPVDFAYHIHTDVGHRCRGAKVNGRIVPLTYELRNGERVEILTARQGGPSRDWLNPDLGYLRTSKARHKVRQWFKLQEHDNNVADGRTAVERELRRMGVTTLGLERIAQRLRYERTEDFLAAVGRGDVTNPQIANAVHHLIAPPKPAPEVEPEGRRGTAAETPGEVKVAGVGNLLTQMARCCHPVPGDPIVGYITRGRGVTVHRQDCNNLLRLATISQERLIEVRWTTQTERTYPVEVHVLAYDRQGLLRDITSVLANEQMNVSAVHSEGSHKDLNVHMILTLEIAELAQLSRALAKINQLPNVIEVYRRA